MYKRNITAKLLEALTDTPVILINGARQTGKSTLVEWASQEKYPSTYYTLDDLATLAAVQSDVMGFIEKVDGHVIIDEVQKAPELMVAIKSVVDKKRRPGQFLLTGSTNVLLLPQLSESLAGRMEIINLWPLSQGEILGVKESFIDNIFSKEMTGFSNKNVKRDELYDRIITGGYPEVLSRQSFSRQQAWFESYITTLLQRDIRELANIEGLSIFPRLLSLLAHRASSLLNQAELSRSSGLSQTTLLRYFTLLEAIFLIYRIPAWSNNHGKRLVKTPKLYFSDTGLLSHLIGMDKTRLDTEPGLIGPLLENFVVTELKKQLTWSKIRAQLFHYRTHTGQEVDIILENAAGQCVAIEIKASKTLSEKDFKGLQAFAEHCDRKFIRGILFYTGNQILPFGKNLFAFPVTNLW